jgi:hypothetical protein
LAAALSLLPDLKHLSLMGNCCGKLPLDDPVAPGYAQVCYFPGSALQGKQLTHLEVTLAHLRGEDGMRHLQGLTQMQDLWLHLFPAGRPHACDINAHMLSGMQHLTNLTIKGAKNASVFEPGALAGKTTLQHLYLLEYNVAGGSAGVAELLSHLQHMQQLTSLTLRNSLVNQEPNPPPAASSALTASSKLHYLDIGYSTLPAEVWQHVFPAGRQLPHLEELIVSFARTRTLDVWDSQDASDAPAGSRMVTCCPALRYSRCFICDTVCRCLAL